jgi:hypothetical protein
MGRIPSAAVGGQGRRTRTRKSAQLFLGSGDFLLHWFLWAVGPAVRVSLWLGLTPDFYNFAGLALRLLSGVLIGVPRRSAPDRVPRMGGGIPLVQGMLGLVAVTTFFTAGHRTVWIARKLRAPRAASSLST